MSVLRASSKILFRQKFHDLRMVFVYQIFAWLALALLATALNQQPFALFADDLSSGSNTLVDNLSNSSIFSVLIAFIAELILISKRNKRLINAQTWHLLPISDYQLKLLNTGIDAVVLISFGLLEHLILAAGMWLSTLHAAKNSFLTYLATNALPDLFSGKNGPIGYFILFYLGFLFLILLASLALELLDQLLFSGLSTIVVEHLKSSSKTLTASINLFISIITISVFVRLFEPMSELLKWIFDRNLRANEQIDVLMVHLNQAIWETCLIGLLLVIFLHFLNALLYQKYIEPRNEH